MNTVIDIWIPLALIPITFAVIGAFMHVHMERVADKRDQRIPIKPLRVACECGSWWTRVDGVRPRCLECGQPTNDRVGGECGSDNPRINPWANRPGGRRPHNCDEWPTHVDGGHTRCTGCAAVTDDVDDIVESAWLMRESVTDDELCEPVGNID